MHTSERVESKKGQRQINIGSLDDRMMNMQQRKIYQFIDKTMKGDDGFQDSSAFATGNSTNIKFWEQRKESLNI